MGVLLAYEGRTNVRGHIMCTYKYTLHAYLLALCF